MHKAINAAEILFSLFIVLGAISLLITIYAAIARWVFRIDAIVKNLERLNANLDKSNKNAAAMSVGVVYIGDKMKEFSERFEVEGE